MRSSAIDERRNSKREVVAEEIRERGKSYLPLLPTEERCKRGNGKVKEEIEWNEREIDARMQEAAVQAGSKKGRGQSGRMKI